MKFLRWLSSQFLEDVEEPLADGDYWVDLAGNPVRASRLALHLIAIGVMRTGKSSLMEGVLRAAVRNRRRVLAIDYEGGLAHRLKHAPAPEGYRVVRVDPATEDNPVGIAWESLWSSPSRQLIQARQLAPIVEGHNRFFDASVQMQVMAAMAVLHFFSDGKGLCSLANLIRLLDYPELLAVASDETPGVKNPFASLGFTEQSARDVLSTVDSRFYHLRILAALDEAATERWDPLSLVDDGPSGGREPHAAVLVFKDLYQHAIGPIFGAIADIVALEQIAEQSRQPLTVSLDELTSLGKLDILAAIRRGSKANLILLMSTHSYEVVKILYKAEADDILNLPGFRVFYRQGSHASAKAASEALGIVEVVRRMAPEIYHRAEKVSQTEWKVDVGLPHRWRAPG
jgi:hypothetical protein